MLMFGYETKTILVALVLARAWGVDSVVLEEIYSFQKS